MDDWQGFSPFVTHLECSATGERFEAGKPHNLSSAGKPLLVRYDLPAVARAVRRQEVERRPQSLWRYRELLPVRRADDIVSLGEQFTPLLHLPATSERHGGGDLIVKDEGRLPTNSFKARGMALAVTMAKSFGARDIALPTVGSGGASLAAYCRRAGITAHVFCPDDAPPITISEIAYYGARVTLLNGALKDCNRLAGEGSAKMGWFDMSTLKEPYRIEGKKTLGLELADQMGWELPDAIFYPTGGGTGFIGMWKAFAELEAIGWIGAKRPKMIAVQTTGCCPIVKAHAEGHREIPAPWPEIRTDVQGVRVAKALGDFLILDVMYESGGFGVAVTDEDVHATRRQVSEDDGVLLSPEGAACVAAWRVAVAEGRVARSDRAVVFNTATGLRTPMPAQLGHVDISKPVDFAGL